MNLVFLLGRVGKIPADALRYTQSGKAVVSFSLVTNEGFGDNQTSTWHDVVAWEKTAENVGKYVEQGQQLLVEGRLTKRSWEAQDGSKRYKTEIVAYRVTFLAKAKNSGGSRSSNDDDTGEGVSDTDPARDVDPDDIPW